ncbi:MAG: WbqC family protein [Candidatus Omnitrophica bacterium]|nr:WbqC family protein [Candidatus Omnitrophota bacterium]
MLCAIHQPQYLPWLGYFEKMARADVFVLLDNVQFKKNEWQNRNRIRTSQGWQWLTVPVRHGLGQRISEVRLNAAVDWRAQHRKAVELNYRKAPFFGQYWPRLSALYDLEWDSLGELNIAVVRLLAELLGVSTRLVTSSELPVTSGKTQRLVDICRALDCDAYLAGAGCEKYMDFGLFSSSGIQLEVQAYRHPVYPQQWGRAGEGFVPYLSVLDLLLNCGPESLTVLRGAGARE